MWNVLVVLGGVVLSVNFALGAPAPATLLNEQKILSECTSSVALNPTLTKLCDLYIHVVQNQTSFNRNITGEFEEIIQKPETDVKNFCTTLVTFPVVEGFLPNQGSCEKRCQAYDLHDEEIVLPLCRLILWRLEIQNAGQAVQGVLGDDAMSSLGTVAAGASTVAGVKVNTTLTNATSPEKQEIAKESTPVPQKPAVPAVTPSGSLVNKVEIPPVVPLGAESISTSTKASDDLPKIPEEEKPKEEEPKINPEPPKSNQEEEKISTQEEPKPPEEIKKQPDIEDDQNEPNLKDLENDGENDNDYDSAEREDAALIKAEQQGNNLDAGDAGLIFDKSEPKDNAAVNGMEVVDAKQDPFQDEDESNFFTYFMCLMIMCILAYVVYHNKTKVLALVLEGRRASQGRNGRRKHTAAYRKLDSNLEEAITSSAASRTQQIIY